MQEAKFDLVVIGGGPGGYVAALRATQLGLSVAVVERENLGGVCLNWGCIPTKALLRSAEVLRLARDAADFGIKVSLEGYDASTVIARSRAVAERLTTGVKYLLKKNKVTVLSGTGRLAGSGCVAVEHDDGTLSDITARHIILATGARSRALPDLDTNDKDVWTYREAMIPEEIPGSVLVIGSGAIGIEFASFYRDFGVDVTVVEILDRILPAEDVEISEFARAAFRKQGMVIHTQSRVSKLVKETAGKMDVTIVTNDGESQKISVEKVILAVGITGNVEDIGLESTGVAVDRGHIVINDRFETGEPGVYAIGDVAGPPWLAHKASHEGILCVEMLAGEEGVHPLDVTMIPGCTYCHPQIASVGLTEAAAREQGHEVRVGRFPFVGNGKAIALGDDQGLVKTVFDAATGELLGAHMIGAEVTELIQGFAIARTLETTEAELMQTVFPHPTLSEMMGESVLAAYDRALHI